MVDDRCLVREILETDRTAGGGAKDIVEPLLKEWVSRQAQMVAYNIVEPLPRLRTRLTALPCQDGQVTTSRTIHREKGWVYMLYMGSDGLANAD